MVRLELATRAWHAPMLPLTPHPHRLGWTVGLEPTPRSWKLHMLPLHHVHVLDFGAGDRHRTCNILFTRQVLCQLSYTSMIGREGRSCTYRMQLMRLPSRSCSIPA
jgi:hypothetical protein